MTAVSRGSRIAIDDNTKVIRPFIWWTNTKDDIIDVDLLVAVFADDWNCLEHVSYSNLKSNRFGICHSGDITNGGPVDGEGVAEFIDLDIDKALSAGARYAVFNVYNFSDENFSKMEHAAFLTLRKECLYGVTWLLPLTMYVLDTAESMWRATCHQ